MGIGCMIQGKESNQGRKEKRGDFLRGFHPQLKLTKEREKK